MGFFFGMVAIVLTKWLFGPTAGLLMLMFILTAFFRGDFKKVERELRDDKSELQELKDNPAHWDVVLESDEDDIMM